MDRTLLYGIHHYYGNCRSDSDQHLGIYDNQVSKIYFIKSEFNTTVTLVINKCGTYGEIIFAANNNIMLSHMS